MAQYEVAVLGAGIIGLSSAVLIQESRPDCHVTIVSELFSPHTTSDGSGGLWVPFYFGEETDPAITYETGRVTYKHMKELSLSPLAGQLGAELLTIVFLEEIARKFDEDFRHYVDYYHELTDSELQYFPRAGCGFSFETTIIDVPSYMKWLMLRFKSSGGSISVQKIDSLSQLPGQWDAVVNCLGLGAAKILNDPHFNPVRGQIMHVEAPWIKHCYIFKPKSGTAYSYLLPRADAVVVGGTGQIRDWNDKVREEDDATIWRNAINVFPQIKSGRKIKSWAGLRPTRSAMRLEAENMNIRDRKLPVIHNYGHGGAGVTLHWGCAQKVLSMLSDALPPKTSPLKSNRSALKHKL